MAQQKLVSYVGLSKQASKGSAGSTPATFGFGVKGGRIFDLPITSDYEELTLNGATSDRFAPQINRTEAAPGAAFQTRAWPKTIGAFLLGALGADSVSGVGPYTHVITPAMTLNYWTLFTKFGSTPEYEKLADCVFDEVTIAWDQRNPVEVDAKLLGITPTFGAGGVWTATNDENNQDFFTPIGATLQLDTDSSTPVTAKIKAGSIKIANNLDPVIVSNAITPDDLVPALQTVEGTFTLVPDDFTDWRGIVAGAAAGTTLQSTTEYGAFSILLPLSPHSLTLATSRCEFLAEYPESDPKGGAMELELAFRVARPTGGTAAFTATLVNATASY